MSKQVETPQGHETHENHENHETHETHETSDHPKPEKAGYKLWLPSPLDAETEALVTKIIGCAIAVHKALGPGFLETIYKKALCIELKAEGLRFECERAVPVIYRGVKMHGQRIDLIVEGQGCSRTEGH
jgi:hypothetical protein